MDSTLVSELAPVECKSASKSCSVLAADEGAEVEVDGEAGVGSSAFLAS